MLKAAALALCALLLSCARRAPPPEAFKLEDACAAKLARGEWEGARRDCAEAARMLPESPVAWPNLSVALLQLHQIDEARPALERAARYADRDPRVHNGLGIVAFTDRRYADAEAQFKRALELNADYAQARFNRAWNFFRWRRYADARAQLRELMARKPELAEAPHFLGLILLTEDRVEEATELLIDAVEKEPRDCRIGSPSPPPTAGSSGSRKPRGRSGPASTSVPASTPARPSSTAPAAATSCRCRIPRDLQP